MKKTVFPRKKSRFWFVLVTGMVGLLWGPGPTAWAHKIYLHAEAVGQKVQGRAYFRGGAPAQETKVEVFLPDGRKLLETKTDANGEFSFQAPARCDYRVVVDTGDGHGAEYTLPGADLPESLPPLEKAQLPSDKKGQSPPKETSVLPPDKPSPGPPEQKLALGSKSAPSAPAKGATPGSPAEWQQAIEEAVHRQIQPLARKIEQMEDRIRWSDVLGGIGYILGLTGMGFYLLGMRRSGPSSANEKPSAGSGSSRPPEAP